MCVYNLKIEKKHIQKRKAKATASKVNCLQYAERLNRYEKQHIIDLYLKIYYILKCNKDSTFFIFKQYYASQIL